MWKRLILVPGLGTPSCQHPASPYLQHLSSLSPRGPGASASPLPPWEVSPGSGLSLLVPRDTACPCGLEGDLWPPPLQALPTSPMTHPHCRERLMLAAALAPSRKRQCPWPLPNLEHCPALFSQLFEAKATPDPRQGPGARSSEACWVGTFQDWLSRGLTTAVELVRAGVSSMEPEDTTQCWGWGPELSHWAARGSPTRGHCVPHTPCIHVLGRGNASVPSWGGRGYMDGQILGQHQPLMEEEEVGRARAAPSPRPAFPEMGSHELRLASFCDWPLTALVRPELLASAGFFHTGQQDKVRCFSCDGRLQSWERGDDPWTQHAMWFPRCEFLLRTKGRDFVCSVQESCCHLLSSWDPWEEPEDTAPSTPSAPVHPGPELPMTRRKTRSEGGREPGVRDTEEQLQRLREERTCKVCLDRTVCIVFVPCGHLVCAECAPHLKQCPICRAPVHSCVRTFLS